MCGLTITFSSAHSGLVSGSGSSAKTSSAAPASLPDTKSLDQCLLVDHGAAADVDEDRALAHAGDRLRPISPCVSAVSGRRDHDCVSLADEVVDRVGRMHRVDVGHRLRDVALHTEHAHPERVRETRHLGTDLADADDEQRLPAELVDRIVVPVPRGGVAGASGEVAGGVNASRPSKAHSAERDGVHAAGARDRDPVELRFRSSARAPARPRRRLSPARSGGPGRRGPPRRALRLCPRECRRALRRPRRAGEHAPRP